MNRHIHIHKETFKIAVIILLISGILFGMYMSRMTYQLNFPQPQKIKRIVFVQKKASKKLTDQDMIADIVRVLQGKTTQQESLNGVPFNVSQKVRLEFHLKFDRRSLYLYRKDHQYYIEEPYNGIYRLSGDEYNSIVRYLK